MKFGIFIYDGVEPIDLATFGVLSMARRIRPDIEICTMAPRGRRRCCPTGCVVMADHALAAAPTLDVSDRDRRPGLDRQTKSPETLALAPARAADTLLVSVCTGGMILGASGVLDGKRRPPSAKWYRRSCHRSHRLRDAVSQHRRARSQPGRRGQRHHRRWRVAVHRHDAASLKKLFGVDVAAETARIIEYQRAWAANFEQFPPLHDDEVVTDAASPSKALTATELQLGRRLCELRAARGFTQDRLAAEAGFTKGYLSKIENSKVIPPIGTLVKIARVLDTDLPICSAPAASHRTKPSASCARGSGKTACVAAARSATITWRSHTSGTTSIWSRS